jgi:hypothetical protein
MLQSYESDELEFMQTRIEIFHIGAYISFGCLWQATNYKYMRSINM